MTEQNASFNPADASGLLDNARVKISAVKVDTFKSKAGESFVNVDVTYSGSGPDTIEHYMLGSADQWQPNAAKTGAVPVTEGGRVWNKSDVIKLIASLIASGFPSARIGTDLSVFVGTDVHVNRVVQEGLTYKDKDGKERQRTTLLVTKVYALPDEKAAKGRKSTAAAAPATAGAEDDDANDAYATEVLMEILGESNNTIAKDKLPQPVFVKLTRAKKAAIRQSVTARLQNDAFLGSLVEAGLIAYDGKTITTG